MAPIKFEENIREKLEGREIQPSTAAWKKLSGQLETVEDKSDIRIMWYAIAASFVGLLIVASVFFSKSDDKTNTTTDLVEVNSSESDDLLEIVQVKKNHNLNESVSNTIAAEEIEDKKLEQTKVGSIEKPLQKKKKEVPQKMVNVNTSETIAKVEVPVHNELLKSQESTQELSENETAINAKVEEVIAKLEQLKINKTAITVEELDALLATAQNEIQTQRVLNSKKVDPAALLGDVELELEQSLRDKVYYALGDGFQFIKTAVVERNN
jgi:hypothetical protein